MLADLRFAVRLLLRAPGFVVVVALLLGLGLGANASVFAAVRTLLFRPLPAADPERLVAIYTSDGGGAALGSSSYPDYQDLVRQSTTLAGALAYTPTSVTVTIEGEPQTVWGALVSASYFPVLGVPLIQGGGFLADDDRPGSRPAVVLGHDLWT